MKAMIKLSLIILTISLIGCEDHSAQDELAKKQLEILKKDEEARDKNKKLMNAKGSTLDGYVYEPGKKTPDSAGKTNKE